MPQTSSKSGCGEILSLLAQQRKPITTECLERVSGPEFFRLPSSFVLLNGCTAVVTFTH